MSIIVHDIFFFIFVLLFSIFVYLLLATLYSLRSPTTRQQRLKTNRFLLRLRQDTALGGIDRTPKPNRGGGKSPYDMPVPVESPRADDLEARDHPHAAAIVRSLVEAMAHPLPFLCM